MVVFIKFVGKNKREVVMKAIDYFYSTRCEKKYSIFLAKCRLQKDHKTVHYYPRMELEIKKENCNEAESTIGHRWSISKLLLWFRGLFK